MKKLRFSLLFCTSVLYAGAQPMNKVTLDLINAKNDQITVRFTPPAISEDEVEFQIPKIVPGTYSISDFGRFVNNLKAYDQQDSLLSVDQVSTNRWTIKNAKDLKYLTFCNKTNIVLIEICITIFDVDTMVFIIWCHTEQQIFTTH